MSLVATRKNFAGFPGDISPQLAVLVDKPPAGEDWIHEIKFDGYRLLAFVKPGEVKLLTRNAKDWTEKFPAIAKSLQKLKVKSAILDGEAVVLDSHGRSDFQALQAMLQHKDTVVPTYFAFDLLFIDGQDWRDRELIERKKKLKEILDRGKLDPRVRFSDGVRGQGEKVFRRACAKSLEGIVSKRADAPYVSRRDASWVKTKCSMRQELVVIGWTDPQGSRTGFGSLLLGYYDERRRLVYAGRVGTGFDDRLLFDLHRQLTALARKSPPTDVDPPARERRHAHWVSPKLVAEVKFTGWTRDRMLRHPVFMGLRTDKPAKQVVREEALSARKSTSRKEQAAKDDA